MPTQDDVNSFFKEKIAEHREAFPRLRGEKDHKIFVFICVRYFFFRGLENFEDISETITDGTGDNSIDAISNDEDTEGNPVALAQCKYSSSPIDLTKAKGEIAEMGKYYADHGKGRINRDTNRSLAEKLDSAKLEIEDDAPERVSPHIFYFTLYSPKEKQKNKIKESLSKDGVDIYFGDEIKQYIESIWEQNPTVSSRELDLDDNDNRLSYGDRDNPDAVVVNASARSLKILYSTHKRNLLGLNLRLYIKNKNVDSGLKKL